MQDPLNKATLYWKEAVKCYELANSASPALLGDFYRRVAVHYLLMAEGELRIAEGQTSGDMTA
jgi:hypothetical protein